jgi:glycosyltransferase involved in cell wall biosynthesis
MNKENRLVSIIVRTKDRPKLLNKALQSIVVQTYRPVEVVLVNDGGCALDIEGLKGILDDIALNYIRLEKNTGRAHAGNVGIENARGEYIGFLDDDDEFYPEHVETLITFLKQSDYKIAYTDSFMVYKEYNPQTHRLSNDVKREIAFSQDFNYDRLVFENYIPFMCLLFERKPLVTSGGFDNSFDLYEDWDLLIRIGNKIPFYHIKRITANYNQWSLDLQISQRNKDPIFLQQAYLKVLSRHIKEITPKRIHDIISEYAHTRQILKYLRNEFESHKNLMREKDSRIDTLTAEVRGRDAQISTLSGELREQGSRIDTLTAEVRGRDAQISTLSGELQAKGSQIDALNGELREKDSRIDTLTAEVRGRDAQISTLSTELRERDLRLSTFTSVIGGKEAEIVGLKNAVQERDGLITAMRNTRGWRMLEKYRRMRDSVLRRKSSE